MHIKITWSHSVYIKALTKCAWYVLFWRFFYSITTERWCGWLLEKDVATFAHINYFQLLSHCRVLRVSRQWLLSLPKRRQNKDGCHVSLFLLPFENLRETFKNCWAVLLFSLLLCREEFCSKSSSFMKAPRCWSQRAAHSCLLLTCKKLLTPVIAVIF